LIEKDGLCCQTLKQNFSCPIICSPISKCVFPKIYCDILYCNIPKNLLSYTKKNRKPSLENFMNSLFDLTNIIFPNIFIIETLLATTKNKKNRIVFDMFQKKLNEYFVKSIKIETKNKKRLYYIFSKKELNKNFEENITQQQDLFKNQMLNSPYTIIGNKNQQKKQLQRENDYFSIKSLAISIEKYF